MKATEKKSTAQAPVAQQEGPFFSREGRGTAMQSAECSSFFQAKLTVNEPGDSYEKEADAVADKVVQRMAEPAGNISSIQTKCDYSEEEEKIQKKEDEQDGPVKIQRKPGFETNAGSAPGSVASGLSSSGGTALPSSVNESMSAAIGNDFSSVRIHNDSAASRMSEDLGAQAFTHGQDIYFNEGKYDPQSNSGKHLLAHELTHTVQQSQPGTIRRKKGCKKHEIKIKPPVAEAYDGPEGMIDVRNNQQLFLVACATIPKVKHIFVSDFANLPHKPQERPNTQRNVWKKKALEAVSYIKGEVEKKSDAEGSPKDVKDKSNQRLFFFRLKKSKNDYVIGTMDEIVNSVIIPSWNVKGEWANKHVDHKQEIQLGGPNTVENLWLMEASANMSCGALINNELNRKIDLLVAAGKKNQDLWKGKDGPGATEIRKNHRILVEQYAEGDKTTAGDEEDKLFMEDITQKPTFLTGLVALKKTEIESANLRGSKSKIRIFFRRSEEQARGWVFELNDWKADETDRKIEKRIGNILFTDITYTQQSSPDKGIGEIRGTAFREKDKQKLVSEQQVVLKINESPAIEYGGYVPISAFRSAVDKVHFIPASDVSVLDVNFDEKNGLTVVGKLLPSIPFMEKADIDIVIDNQGVRLRKIFTAGEIKLPGPFSITNSSLEMSVGSKGFSVAGNINLAIANVGEGCIAGSVDQDGNVKLNGEFNIAAEMFEKSAICFSYERNSAGESKYIIGGHLAVGRGKIKGIKKAEATVTFDGTNLVAKATATPDIKNVGEIKMILAIEKDKYSFGGSVPLNGLVPKVKSGSLEIVVIKGTDGVKVNGKGTAVPDIPGLTQDPSITLEYTDGIIMIKGDLPFTLEKAKASGKISLGMTNQVMDANNQPTGKLAEEWTVFGAGSVTVELAKNIFATGNIKLNPNGDIIVSGQVELDTTKQKVEKKEPYKKTIFEVHPPDVVLFVIPPIGASLTLGVKGGAYLWADYELPHVKKLILELNDVNLTTPDDNVEIIGTLQIGASAKGGLELYLTLIATLSVLLVAKVSGELTGSIGVEASGDVDATLVARWSKLKGLSLDKGELSVSAKAQFLAKLTGKLRVYIDLWLTEIGIWEESLDIASVKFGEGFEIGFKIPIGMKDGGLHTEDLNEKSFTVPNVDNDTEKQRLVHDATSEDPKVKPPPPPSIENAIAAINRLPPGPLDYDIVVKLSAEDAKTLVDFGWIVRDTYLKWLSFKYPKIEWNQVAVAAAQKDDKDFESVKPVVRDGWLETTRGWVVDGFGEDHFLFKINHPEKIKELYEIAKNPDKRSEPAIAPPPANNIPAPQAAPPPPPPAAPPPTDNNQSNKSVEPKPFKPPAPNSSQMPAPVQKKSEPVSSATITNGAVPNSVESGMKSKTKGKRLPASIANELGSEMNADFSAVNIHNDEQSFTMNRQLSAKAFTHGRDIYFDHGNYDPESRVGKKLLAHELTHVLQQNNSMQERIHRSPVSADIPNFSQVGDSCGAASLVAAILAWDRQQSPVTNSAFITASNITLSYLSMHHTGVVERLKAQNISDPEKQYNNLVLTLTNGRDNARTAGATISETEYQILSIALYRLHKSDSRGGLSAGEISNIRTRLGIDGVSNSYPSLDKILSSPEAAALKPGETAQVHWLSKTGVQHVFTLGRLIGGAGDWFIQDQGQTPAFRLQEASLMMLRINLFQAIDKGQSWLLKEIPPGTPVAINAWMGIRVNKGLENLKSGNQSLLSNGQFVAEIDAGPFTNGNRLLVGNYVGLEYDLAKAEKLYTNYNVASCLIIEMPAGVYNVYEMTLVSEANVSEKKIDVDDSKGGVLDGKKYFSARMLLSTNKKNGGFFTVY